MDTLAAGIVTQINYWAVLVAGLAAFFIGGLWYSPVLFEGAWLQANGYGPDELERIQAALGPGLFGGAILAYLVVAAAFAMLVVLLGVDSLAAGLSLALLVWVGFVASTGLTVNLFSVRPLAAWLIDAGFQLVFLLIFGAILSLWR